MRKLLLLLGLILFLFSNAQEKSENQYSVGLRAAATKKITPEKSFVGILNANNAYSKQSLEQNPKTIILGNAKDDNKGIGRGYLEFDLSSIPKNSTINSVSLQLTSDIKWDSNFNGKIRVDQATGRLMDANSTIWNMMSPIMAINQAVINLTFEKEGVGYECKSDFLTSLVKENLGYNLYLTITHQNENNNVVRLSGEDSALFLLVNYTDNSGGVIINPDPELSKIDLNGPSEAYTGDIITISYKYYNHLASWYTNWFYDGSELECTETKKSGDVYTKVFKINPIYGKDFINSRISIIVYLRGDGESQYRPFHEGICNIRILNNPEFIIQSPKYICNNASVELSGLHSYANAEISWASANNLLTVKSGQGTPNPIFEKRGNGLDRIIANINYNKKTYTITSNDIWVGLANPEFIFNKNLLYYNTAYSLKAENSPSVNIYKWTITTGDVYFYTTTGIAKSVTTYGNENQVLMQTGSGNMEMNPFTIKCEMSTDCGETVVKTINALYLGKIPGLPPIGKTSINVYSINTGEKLYTTDDDNFNIESTNLKSGLYIIEKTNEEGTVARQKVIKR